MAVRTKEEEVLEPVVITVPVDVMEGDAQGFFPPLGEAALFTALLLETGLQQPVLQVTAIAAPTLREQLFDRDQHAPSGEPAGASGLVPG